MTVARASTSPKSSIRILRHAAANFLGGLISLRHQIHTVDSTGLITNRIVVPLGIPLEMTCSSLRRGIVVVLVPVPVPVPMIFAALQSDILAHSGAQNEYLRMSLQTFHSSTE